MMAAVFLMQPLGQLLASVVGLAVLLTVGRNLDKEDIATQPVTVDRIWRYVVGVGAIPALVAIGFRLTIPESPRFTLDVDHDGARALRDAQRYYNKEQVPVNGDFTSIADDPEYDAGLPPMPRAALDPSTDHAESDDDDDRIITVGGEISDDDNVSGEPQKMPDPFSRRELVQYFWTEGNIKYLAGTCSTWFLFDFAFYALGINNPRVIAQIWSSKPVPASQAPVDEWQNPSNPNQTIYELLRTEGIRSIITISIGSMLGSIILIKVINYIPRKSWLAWSFVVMAALFAIIGGSYFRAADSDLHALTITLYVLCQLVFNLGPNTLTFIIPAEIFPTRYRATCHGISAAAGKLASVIVQAFLPRTQITNPNSKNLGWVLIGFSFAMALGALCAWAWIPDVQDPRGTDLESRGSGRGRFKAYEVPSKSLEELAVGRQIGVEDEKDMIGFRKRSRRFVGELREAGRRNSG
jgi:PHS family inorganic phosphate transporter-like MFS transporter